ncbi:MAG: family oxidoreductase [Gammaproteobacteria bacterium]|jgi:NAD(P)-dependent dehydrogenase (short-subunit alcohol dehydrogenase family)|nr:family oxidoreductase [Gammaproteobacteria bacterium]
MGSRFDGAVIIVTGAADGIGHGIAAGFCRAGATVYGLDINVPMLQAAGRRLEHIGGCFKQCVADVANPEDINVCVEQIKREAARIDVLVNNAGVNMNKRIADLGLEDWDRALDTNLKSVYMMCKAVWPVFVQQRAGVIINIASVMGQVGGIGAPAYCSSKAGIIMLSRCLAKDGARFGIRVNSICPGYIDTPIMDRLIAEQPDPAVARRQIMDRQPLGRMGTPEDVAQGALFLASAHASFVSGTELTIDGAVTATQID